MPFEQRVAGAELGAHGVAMPPPYTLLTGACRLCAVLALTVCMPLVPAVPAMEPVVAAAVDWLVLMAMIGLKIGS